ncbi:MAG: hypothetical protein NZ602_07870 [Thermoguttaceae bacterium]|nr:hypothetical protein [Thermoguttaceae bacterium]MDW8038439.1 DUF6798 domain-containing protein [Thermoguttaceae bacterium]
MSQAESLPTGLLWSEKRWSWLWAVELAGVFLIFFLQGAWPVPDTNEPHYLGKAIHYWNPGWICRDFFLDSPDAHDVFYFTFGWLARYLAPAALAWVGRIFTWLWLAWAWQRLSWAVLPKPGYAVLSAALLAALTERAHMAGEWLIGGLEAKGFAWALVFMGLEQLLRGRWNWALACFGGGTSFHALVGGWGGIAAALTWLFAGKQRPRLRCLWPGILTALVLAAPGLIPVARLNWGVDPETVRQGYQIYVEIRLPHHLDFLAFRPEYRFRFLLLCLACWLLSRSVHRNPPVPQDRPEHTIVAVQMLRWYWWATMMIVGCGIIFSVAFLPWPNLRILLLRYYWFRLADIITPAATSLFLLRWVAEKTASLVTANWAAPSKESFDLLPSIGQCFWPPCCGKDRPQRWVMLAPWAVVGLATLGAFVHLGGYVLLRIRPCVPRAFVGHRDKWKNPKEQLAEYISWRRMCQWIQQHTPPEARFLTPRQEQTFKWYAHRSEVATWKDIPQDAAGLVEWWNRMQTIYATGNTEPGLRWIDSLAQLPPEKLRLLAHQYQAQYLVVESRPQLPFRLLYRNRHWAVYEIGPPSN